MNIFGSPEGDPGEKIPPLHKNNAVNLNVKKTNMVQRVAGFLVVFLLMFFGSSSGQRFPAPGITVPGLKKTHFQVLTKPFKSQFSPIRVFHSPEGSARPDFSLLKLPTGSTYINNLGFFCRQELKLDKVLAIPIRFRLGSKEYVDELEYGTRNLPKR